MEFKIFLLLLMNGSLIASVGLCMPRVRVDVYCKLPPADVIKAILNKDNNICTSPFVFSFRNAVIADILAHQSYTQETLTNQLYDLTDQLEYSCCQQKAQAIFVVVREPITKQKA